jgi:hypothetical protein
MLFNRDVDYEIGRIVGTAGSTMMVLLIAKFLGLFKDRRRPQTIQVSAATAKAQEVILKKLMDEVGASGCYFTKYHNGDHFVDDSDILKKSRVAEVRRERRSPYQLERFKNLLVSAYSEESDLVQEPGPSFFVTEAMPLCPFKQLLEDMRVIAGARCAVWRKGLIIGFVGADFDSTEPPENINEMVKYADWIARTE